MKKWGFLIVVSFVLLLSACSSKDKDSSSKVDDEVSKENPSGDLAPLEEKVKVVIAEDGSAS